jgi:DNA-binding MarR family transcriptional regulator
MIRARYHSDMPPDGPPNTVAFLLAQIGAHAAAEFAERIGEHGLTPPQAGILGLLRARPGISQQELAEVLGMLPSRVVAFVDELESAGYVERVRDDTDRRRNSLQLTAAGRGVLRTIGGVSRAHDAAVTAALTPREHETLATLLGRIAAEQGLTPGVHPGYRSLRPPAARR